MKKKILLFSMVLCLAFSGVGMAAMWCDNYGQDWDISFDYCSDPASVICVNGVRDADGSLGCGPFPLDGTLTLDLISRSYVLSVTAFDSPSDSCVSTHWNGVLSANGFTGSVGNEFGPFGSFTLTPGSCPAGADDVADPAE
jgi:hypothetical protein